uniref:SKI family transcriptional corepressor 2 n=1 Tax=Eptatretus burgeri TaxID=7764 RepID=A0A8C4Q1S2_EPTBU
METLANHLGPGSDTRIMLYPSPGRLKTPPPPSLPPPPPPLPPQQLPVSAATSELPFSMPQAAAPSTHIHQGRTTTASTPAALKPNQVREVLLYGVPIVALMIDGKERLCLAQISNTLLKNFSYNEIHNRRVALGITCVQCTPVQLEVLRRAGAMPVSSRRCGMITKREAERLCKSFLGDSSPPRLPDNFAFEVSHECSWGCRGSFIPARYNSSRAKCIKCSSCGLYFSPNKFIFHSHRTSESKYTQPDAANFNSWRRHLRLAGPSVPDALQHIWEDVKAMFNGGSRKRALPSSCRPSPAHLVGRRLDNGPSSGHSSAAAAAAAAAAVFGLPPPVLSSPELHGAGKRLRPSCDDGMQQANAAAIAAVSSPLSLTDGVRPYPLIPVPSKGFGASGGAGVLQKLPAPVFPGPYAFPAFGLCPKKDDNALGVPGTGGSLNLPQSLPPPGIAKTYPAFSGLFWPPHAGGIKDATVLYPSLHMFWPTRNGAAALGPMSSYSSALQLGTGGTVSVGSSSGGSAGGADTTTNGPDAPDSQFEVQGHSENRRQAEDVLTRLGPEPAGHIASPRRFAGNGSVCSSGNAYLSAFRPVVRDAGSFAKLYANRDMYGGHSPDELSDPSSSVFHSDALSEAGVSDSEQELDVGSHGPSIPRTSPAASLEAPSGRQELSDLPSSMDQIIIIIIEWARQHMAQRGLRPTMDARPALKGHRIVVKLHARIARPHPGNSLHVRSFTWPTRLPLVNGARATMQRTVCASRRSRGWIETPCAASSTRSEKRGTRSKRSSKVHLFVHEESIRSNQIIVQ